MLLPCLPIPSLMPTLKILFTRAYICPCCWWGAMKHLILCDQRWYSCGPSLRLHQRKGFGDQGSLVWAPGELLTQPETSILSFFYEARNYLGLFRSFIPERNHRSSSWVLKLLKPPNTSKPLPSAREQKDKCLKTGWVSATHFWLNGSNLFSHYPSARKKQRGKSDPQNNLLLISMEQNFTPRLRSGLGH